MCKKLFVTALSATALAGLAFGTDAGSYLTTACSRATSSVADAVPVGFQIDRAKQLVEELAPEVRKAMHAIAKEEIALELLDDEIAAAEERAEKGKRAILRLQADLDTGQSKFRYAGHSYSRAAVAEDLSRRFTRHKVGDETLGHLQRMRDARQEALNSARLKLTAMVSTQKQLEADLLNLQAKQNLVTVAQATTDVRLDDSRLARAKELIADIRSRLDVTARLAHADTPSLGEIPLDAPASAEITDQVAAYFDLPREAYEDLPREAGEPAETIAVVASVPVD